MSYLEPGVAPNGAIDRDFVNYHASPSWLFYKYKSDTFKPITEITAFNGKIIHSLCRGLDGLLVPSAFFFFFFLLQEYSIKTKTTKNESSSLIITVVFGWTKYEKQSALLAAEAQHHSVSIRSERLPGEIWETVCQLAPTLSLACLSSVSYTRLDMTSCPNAKHEPLSRSLFIITGSPQTPLAAALMSLFCTIFRWLIKVIIQLTALHVQFFCCALHFRGIDCCTNQRLLQLTHALLHFFDNVSRYFSNACFFSLSLFSCRSSCKYNFILSR